MSVFISDIGKILNIANYYRKGNKNCNEVYTPVRMTVTKSLQIINAGEGVKKREPFNTVGGNVNWYNYHG